MSPRDGRRRRPISPTSSNGSGDCGISSTYCGSPAAPLIWCGDLNVAPEDIDVHDPKRLLGHVCFTPEVWEAFAAVRSWGLEDLFRRRHPGKPGRYTFFDYRVPAAVKRGLGWRIDHILATPPLARPLSGLRDRSRPASRRKAVRSYDPHGRLRRPIRKPP